MSSSRGSSPPSKRKKEDHQPNTYSDSAQWLNQTFVVPQPLNYVLPPVPLIPPIFPSQYPQQNWIYPPMVPPFPYQQQGYPFPNFPTVYPQIPPQINLPVPQNNRPPNNQQNYLPNTYNIQKERQSQSREKSPDRNLKDYRDYDRPSSRENRNRDKERERPSSRDSRDRDRPSSRDLHERNHKDREREFRDERDRYRDYRDTRDHRETREREDRDNRDRELRDGRDREIKDINRPSSRGRERRPKQEETFRTPSWHKSKPYGFKKYKDTSYIFNKQVIYDTIYRNSFVGEGFIPKCGKDTAKHLHAYKVVITPPLNSQSKTSIHFENEDYNFAGFLILSHQPFNVPSVSFSRTGVEHTAAFQKTEVPSDLNIESMEEFHRLFFDKILQVKQWSNDQTEHQSCRNFHFYPTFETQTFLPDPNLIALAEEGETIESSKTTTPSKVLPLEQVLKYMKDSDVNVLNILKQFDLHNPNDVQQVLKRLQDYICVTDYPGPAYRVDDLDLLATVDEKYESPAGWLSYYDYLRSVGLPIRYLRQPLLYHKNMGATENGQREQPHVKLVPEFCRMTGLKTDICLMGILLPTMSYHIRLFCSLAELEKRLNVRFHDKRLLRKAFTHPSYSEIYFAHVGEIKAAHGRVGDYLKVSSSSDIEVNLNAAANVTPVGNRMRLKGFQKLFSMAQRNQNMGSVSSESVGELFSYITHNERLEFLGDAVLEFIVTSHLTLQFPHLKEGDLATYRTLLINNRFLSHLFQQMQLQPFVLYAASSDLLEEGDAREHMFADCFEALIGAIYIDQGLQACRQFYAQCLFHGDKDLLQMWMAPKKHILQDSSQDSSFLENSATVAKFGSFEEQIGYKFRSIKLLIQAFTHPSVSKSFDALDIGTNAILEFLGDAVLQFLTSRHLFTHYPHFQEGKLTLMRSALVNNQTISDVADEVGIGEFMRYFPADLNTSQNMIEKDSKNFSFMMANAFEAFLGALYLDRNLEVAETFLRVALFPRLSNAVTSQDWLDPKTKLSRLVFSVTKDKQFAPSYRLVREMGPPHMRQFVVAVYFSGEEIGRGEGYSKHSAEQEAAQQASRVIKNMFPQAMHRGNYTS